MEALLLVVVGLLLLVGFLGSFLPFVPGTPLILVAALVDALATSFDPIGPGRLLVLAGLAALGYALDYVAGALGTRKLGGSGWGVAGALLGGLVGIFFAPVGLLVGPILGAIAGETLRSGNLDGKSLKSGLGAFFGMLAGVLAKGALATVMVSLILWWLIRG